MKQSKAKRADRVQKIGSEFIYCIIINEEILTNRRMLIFNGFVKIQIIISVLKDLILYDRKAIISVLVLHSIHLYFL